MQEKLNINLILCKDFDEETKTIYKMFNEITTNEKHRATFTLVTFVNSIKRRARDDEKNNSDFVLHYYLMEQKRDENGKRKGIYLGAIGYTDNDQNNSTECGFEEKNSTFAQMEFNGAPFLNETEYRIEAYMVKGNIDSGLNYFELKKDSAKYRSDGELVSAVAFNVKFPKQ